MHDVGTDGALHGRAAGTLEQVVERLDGYLAADPDLSFQAAAYHRGQPVLDVWGGPHLREDSVLVPFSVTKNTIGVVAGLLIERGQLDLDARVADYWPEFAAHGKQHVTVRQLLSHQAGLPQATPALTWAELFEPRLAAQRLADSVPFWFPGTAFGYHGVTIGTLASELVLRATGRTLHEIYEDEIRKPHGIDFFLGLPSEHEYRRATVLPMVPPAKIEPSHFWSALGPVVWNTPGPARDLANDPDSWRFGHPAVSGTGSARGLARLLAATVTGVEGGSPLLNETTVLTIGQQQVRGYDEVLGQPHRSHGIVFQKPTPSMAFGGPRAFGHDGAMGAFACVDPDTGVSFAWTIARGAWPGGGDPRAISLAAELGTLLA